MRDGHPSIGMRQHSLLSSEGVKHQVRHRMSHLFYVPYRQAISTCQRQPGQDTHSRQAAPHPRTGVLPSRRHHTRSALAMSTSICSSRTSRAQGHRFRQPAPHAPHLTARQRHRQNRQRWHLPRSRLRLVSPSTRSDTRTTSIHPQQYAHKPRSKQHAKLVANHAVKRHATATRISKVPTTPIVTNKTLRYEGIQSLPQEDERNHATHILSCRITSRSEHAA